MTSQGPVPDTRPSLLVSANADVVDLYVLSLRNARIGLLSVGGVEEALQLVRDRSVSAVIVDVADPGTDWEVCRRLRMETGEDVPLIVLTGWIDADARRQAEVAGCAAFVAKPASADQLLDVLRRTRRGERGIVCLG
jgi:DNA-binding response OmpR family regulator